MENTIIKSTAFVIVLFLILLVYSSTTNATEDFARQTARPCSICHLDPAGGGELTELGRGFLLSLGPSAHATQRSGSPISRLIRIVVGYIHIMTGFLWFGTILYVHLVLKPAYASQGLPRSEVKVGLGSMAVMAITGAILTFYRIDSLHLLVSSRFGILLLIKITIFSCMAASALYVVLVIGPKLHRKKDAALPETGEMNLEELSRFDGQDGRPAYIAYQGKIYDVGASRFWKSGSHMKRHQAGFDLTDTLSQAPHGEDKVTAMPEVGILLAGTSSTRPAPHIRVFYFMAYMNLGLVFVITLILALWRWY